MLVIIVILIVVALVLYFVRPWSRTNLLNDSVSVEYEEWTDGWGGAGKKVNLLFKMTGYFKVVIKSPKEYDKERVNDTDEIEYVHVTQKMYTRKSIDIASYAPYVIVTVTNYDGASETCKLYS